MKTLVIKTAALFAVIMLTLFVGARLLSPQEESTYIKAMYVHDVVAQVAEAATSTPVSHGLYSELVTNYAYGMQPPTDSTVVEVIDCVIHTVARAGVDEAHEAKKQKVMAHAKSRMLLECVSKGKSYDEYVLKFNSL